MNLFKRMKENEHAVSPIVATLVLIVVAVVGAVAVGTIMGTFSSDVAEDTSAAEVGAASSTELLIAGSTTVQPVSEEIKIAYEAVSPGVKVSVQGGGSGAGVNSVGMGLVDIGSSSDYAKIETAKSAHPEWDLRETQVGGSGVVFITSDELSCSDVTATDLKTFYETGVAGTNLTSAIDAYHRAEASGTEETAAKWVRQKSDFDDITANTHLKSATGNAGILAAVQGSANAVGFVDMGFVWDSTGTQASGIDVLNIVGYTTTSKDTIKDAAKGVIQGYTSTKYPNGLARGLYYITQGEPSIIEKDFINFAAGPGSLDAVHDAGVFHILDLM